MKFSYALLLCILFNSVQAQQIIFKEDFNSYQGLNIPNWDTKTHTASVGWRTSDMYNLYCSYSKIPQYAYFERVAAISDCEGFVPRPNHNVFMFSKPIDLSQVTQGAVLKYDSYFFKRTTKSQTEHATVEISVNKGVSWTVIHDVPKGKTEDSLDTHYINISQYIGYSNVLIGFRYNDGGGVHQNGGWTVDNIELFRPEQKDLALTHFYPEKEVKGYRVINNGFSHTGEVRNYGLDTIKEFIVNYQNAGGVVMSDTFLNISIPPFATYSFTHKVKNVLSAIGALDVTAWVTTPGDNNATNDTQRIVVNGVQFIPKKKVLLEEGTGNWNMFAPRGYTYMDAVATDGNVCLVSVHGGDPMEYDEYSDYLYNLDYYFAQYFLLDRKVSPDETNFYEMINEYAGHFGFADLEIHGYIAQSGRAEVGVTVKPAINMKGDFRLALILTEDNVSGTGDDWRQYNMHYSGGKNGPMGGYENKPDTIPAAEMEYNYVARLISPAPDGGKTFATELKAGADYWHKFSVALKPEWDRNKLRATVVLLREDDTTVLNSNCLSYFLSVSDDDFEQEFKAGLYPNPANSYTNLEFEAKQEGRTVIAVYDISGRIQYSTSYSAIIGTNKIKIPTASLPTGLYILQLKNKTEKRTFKLHVVH